MFPHQRNLRMTLQRRHYTMQLAYLDTGRIFVLCASALMTKYLPLPLMVSFH